MNKRKKTYIEIIRILAMFLVLFNHTDTWGIWHYRVTGNTVNYYLGLMLQVVAQTCVPLFFMVTGAVLLHKQESFKQVYRKRVLRIVIVILLAVLFQYFCNYLKNPLIGFTFQSYFQITYGGGAITQQWYLYTYLTLLMILPLMQRFAQSVPEGRWFLYMLGMCTVVEGVLPIVEYEFQWFSNKFAFPLFADVLLFTFLGYYVEHKSEQMWNDGKKVALLCGISAAALIKNVQLMHETYQSSGTLPFLNAFTPLYTFTIFVIIRFVYYKIRIPEWLERTLVYAGGGTFGCYLAEPQIRELCAPIYESLHTVISSYPACFLWIAAALALGIVDTNLLKKVPGVDRLL